MKTRGRLAAYPGLDFLSSGKFLVAPGSLHPDTGQPYLLDEPTPPISEASTAPRELLRLLVRTDDIAPSSSAGKSGIITNEQLDEMLAVLDPRDYGKGKHDKWLELAFACHDATAGAGLEVFLDWCARDPDYADEVHQESARKRWPTLAWKERGDTTYRTLFAAVSAAGRPDLVAAIDDGDAIDEEFLVHEFEEPEDG